jgi:hypothetical protein
VRVLSAVLLLLQAVISVRTELVAVPALVTDSRGHHVSRLSPDNCRIFEGSPVEEEEHAGAQVARDLHEARP